MERSENGFTIGVFFGPAANNPEPTLAFKEQKRYWESFLCSGVFILFRSEASDPERKTRHQREIEATDHQIDQLIHELYGLTEEEINIVETDNGSK
jgi:hypothetical protein